MFDVVDKGRSFPAVLLVEGPDAAGAGRSAATAVVVEEGLVEDYIRDGLVRVDRRDLACLYSGLEIKRSGL